MRSTTTHQVVLSTFPPENFQGLPFIITDDRNLTTRDGLYGLRIKSRWGRDFPHASWSAMGSTQPPIQWVTCLSRG